MMAKYESITKYIPLIENGNFGDWAPLKVDSDDVTQMPYVDYSDLIMDFLQDFYAYMTASAPFLRDYQAILAKYLGAGWNIDRLPNVDVTSANEELTLALIMTVLRADRFAEGTLLHFLKNGRILAWLKHLQELDVQK